MQTATLATEILAAANGRARVVPLTVEQYHQMLAAGILEEGAPIELLDGLLVEIDRSPAGEKPMTVGPHHRLSVSRWLRWLPQIEAKSCHLQLQAPITIPPNHEPEPDVTIVHGAPDDFADHHPGPSEVACVIEVADSSLERDRSTKQRIYASAGVPQYLIVNLIDERVELYEEPDTVTGRYRLVTLLGRGDVLSLRVGDTLQLPVADLLP